MLIISDHHRTWRTATDLNQERCRALTSMFCQLPINTALKACRCIRMQSIAPRLTSNRNRIEIRTLKEYRGCLLRNPGMLTTHDSGKRQWFFLVSNHQHVIGQCECFPIKKHQLLAIIRHPYIDCPDQLITVECVHRLPEFQHDVVGNIHNCINRTNTTSTQTLDHPNRRWATDINILDHTTDVTWTALWRRQIHIVRFVRFRIHRVTVNKRHLSLAQNAKLSSQTCDRQTITAVRCEINFHHLIRK